MKSWPTKVTHREICLQQNACLILAVDLLNKTTWFSGIANMKAKKKSFPGLVASAMHLQLIFDSVIPNFLTETLHVLHNAVRLNQDCGST